MERARRVSGGRLGAGSADSAGSRAASKQAGEGRRVEEEGGGGESAAPRPYKERAGEGAGRGGEADEAGNSPRKGPWSCPGAGGSAKALLPPPPRPEPGADHPSPSPGL